jgi:hypothetical protein
MDKHAKSSLAEVAIRLLHVCSSHAIPAITELNHDLAHLDVHCCFLLAQEDTYAPQGKRAIPLASCYGSSGG